MNVKEIRIPISWGHIAGKTWGKESDPVVLVLHGYQDNAGSFDNLMPLLPATFFYVCLDLPGHGKSSTIPSHTFVSFVDYVLTLKHVADYYQRSTYVLLGHSYGAQTSVLFAQTFPERVSKLVVLDAVYYIPIAAKQWIPELREILQRRDKFHGLERDGAPSYTLQEAVDRMRSSRWAEISEAGAETILRRSLEPQGDGKYRLTTAQALKYSIRPPLSAHYQTQLIRHFPIQCPHLFVGAAGSQAFRDAISDTVLELRKNPKCRFEVVDGEHDVHVDYPERVAPLVSEFLSQHAGKL